MRLRYNFISIFIILVTIIQIISPINLFAQDNESIEIGDTSISMVTVDTVGENKYKISKSSGYTIVGETIQPGIYTIKGNLTIYRSIDSFKEYYINHTSNDIVTTFKEPLCEIYASNKKAEGVELKEGQVLEVSLNTTLTKESQSDYRSGFISVGQSELIQPGKYDFLVTKKSQTAYVYKDDSNFGSMENDFSYLLKKDKWVNGINLEEGNEVVFPKNTKIRKSKSSDDYITTSGTINIGENEMLKPGTYDIYQSDNKVESLQIFNSLSDFNEENENKQDVVLKKKKWTKGITLEEGNVLLSLPSNTKIRPSKDKCISGKIKVSESGYLKPGTYDFNVSKINYDSISVYDSVNLYCTDDDYKNNNIFDNISFDKDNQRIRGVVLEEGMTITVPENTDFKTSKKNEYVGSIKAGQNMQLKSGKYDLEAVYENSYVYVYNTMDDYTDSKYEASINLKKGEIKKGLVIEEGQVISIPYTVSIKASNNKFYSGNLTIGNDKKITPGFYDISSVSKKSQTICIYENKEKKQEFKIFYQLTVPPKKKRKIYLREGNVVNLGSNIKIEKCDTNNNYLTGVIRVGEDIPSGTYNLYSLYKNSYFSLYSNEDNFDSNNSKDFQTLYKKKPLFSYELHNGNYLKIEGCLKYERVGDVSEIVENQSENYDQSMQFQGGEEQIQTKTSEQIKSELKKKLDPDVATMALEKYGEKRYRKFKLHIAFGTIAEEPKDENTWLLKYNVTVVDYFGNKSDTTVEAYVTGTTSNPEISYFHVY